MGDLEVLEAAMSKAAAELVAGTVEARGQVRQLVQGWVSDSESRQAQLGFDDRLGAEIEDLGLRLTRIASALATVREAAHDAEVRNVAILD